jgi:hypothetical protein
MNDELKQAWQSQASQPRLTLDAGLVLTEVRRNERQFAALIYSRDVLEVGVALLLVPVWIFMGIKQALPWSWYLVIPTLLWIAGFMIVDRRRQRRRQPGAGATLRSSIESSLALVEHQIWLLRNVFWWYLLPILATLTIFIAHRAWLSGDDGLSALGTFAGPALGLALVGWFVYGLNKSAVRHQLEPRQQELQTLLGSLNESEAPSSE